MTNQNFIKKEGKDPDATLVQELCAHVFNTEPGKKLLQELKKRFVDVPIWRPGMPQDSSVYFIEGQRHLVMWLQESAKFKS